MIIARISIKLSGGHTSISSALVLAGGWGASSRSTSMELWKQSTKRIERKDRRLLINLNEDLNIDHSLSFSWSCSLSFHSPFLNCM